MKRIRVHEFGAPEVMWLEDAADFTPRADEVVVRVKAVGVNPYDTYIRSGSYGARSPALPYTPGTDAAGLVASVGPEVSGFAPGDRVYTSSTLSGAYAEMALCRESQVHRLHDGLSFAQGAAINVPYATAQRALFTIARVQPGETLLVHGASGGVGIAALQLARAAGLHVIGTAGTEQGLALVEREGAHRAIGHHELTALEQVQEATGGHGVDVVLEMLANVNLEHDLSLLAPRGRIVVVGCRGPVEINPRWLMLKDASLHGLLLWNLTAEEVMNVHAALWDSAKAGTLRPVVALELPLHAADRAHRRILEPGALGKIVLLP